MKKLNKEQFNEFYDILVKEASAPEHLRDSFIQSFMNEKYPSREYTCCYGLGSGGKFYFDGYDNVWVANYPETSNEVLNKKITKLNSILKSKLKQFLE